MAPVVSCVWSCPPQTALAYPARSLFTFLDHHGALTVTGSPHWRTVVGGSRTLRRTRGQGAHRHRALDAGPPASRRTARRGRDPRRRRRDPLVRPRGGRDPRRRGARACSPDRPRAEHDVLGAFGYSTNETVLHTDGSGLPTPRTRAGIVELSPGRVQRRRRRGAGELRHEPAPPARRAATTTSSR